MVSTTGLVLADDWTLNMEQLGILRELLYLEFLSTAVYSRILVQRRFFYWV